MTQQGMGHTSSIVAWNFVPGASYHGIGTGTVAGIDPRAHIAMYKVCKNTGCDDSAILAGLDAAIKDGVDILSLSLGFSKGVRFDQDPIAIGAFSAISKGILVVCAAGNGALIKSTHPTWSPAAIKSAILTTTDIVDSTGGPILDHLYRKASAYDTGSGHVNPTRAADPGLVYDLSITDYAGYICWLLGDHGLATIVHNSSLNCAMLPKVKNTQLNYPMITVPVTSTPFTVNRTVTNVGLSKSTYTAKVDAPKSMVVHVFPEKLTFSKLGEKKTFSLTVSSHLVGKEEFVEGSLRWVSEKHVVRSPIVASVRVKDGYSAPAPFRY
ncbi:hypothetical protein ACQ4PT_014866 [Festuca glaucescens]